MSMLHSVYFLTCTTHVNFMESHIVCAAFVPDLYYKLAWNGCKHSRNMSPYFKL